MDKSNKRTRVYLAWEETIVDAWDNSVVHGAAESILFVHDFMFLFLTDDKNRVELEKVDGDDASDYVNASFVKVCSQFSFLFFFFFLTFIVFLDRP